MNMVMMFLAWFLKVDSVPLTSKDGVADLFKISSFFSGVQHMQFSAVGNHIEIRFLQHHVF